MEGVRERFEDEQNRTSRRGLSDKLTFSSFLFSLVLTRDQNRQGLELPYRGTGGFRFRDKIKRHLCPGYQALLLERPQNMGG